MTGPAGVLRTRAAVVRERNGPVQVVDVDLGPPGPGEIRVAVEACGICHSDVLAIHGGIPEQPPLILGHETVGRIEATGPGVDLVVGQRVLLAWRNPCGTCRPCRRQGPAFCLRPVHADTAPVDADEAVLARAFGIGGMASHALVHVGQCVPVGDDLDPVPTSIVGCGVMTGYGSVVRTAAGVTGDHGAVFGCGGVGTAAGGAASRAGAATVVAIDPDPDQRALAGRLGADLCLDPDDDVATTIRRATDGEGLDVAIEAAGHHDVLALAFRCLGVGGTVVQVGSPRPVDHLPIALPQLFLKRATITASIYGDTEPRVGVPELLDLYRSGELPLDEFVGGTIGLSEVPAWFAAPTSGRRTVVVPD